MAYNATYTDADISGVAVDGVVKVVIAFASLATLVGLIVIYAFMRKQWKK